MLVRVSKEYAGTFGLFDPKTASITLKDNTSAPFEMDDALAALRIRDRVLVRADHSEVIPQEPVVDIPESAPGLLGIPDAPPNDIPDTLPEDVIDIPEGEPDEEEMPTEGSYEAMSFQELKKAAKDAKINSFGLTKAELIEKLKEV